MRLVTGVNEFTSILRGNWTQSKVIWEGLLSILVSEFFDKSPLYVFRNNWSA